MKLFIVILFSLQIMVAYSQFDGGMVIGKMEEIKDEKIFKEVGDKDKDMKGMVGSKDDKGMVGEKMKEVGEIDKGMKKMVGEKMKEVGDVDKGMKKMVGNKIEEVSSKGKEMTETVSKIKDDTMSKMAGMMKSFDLSVMQNFMDDQYGKMKGYMGMFDKMKGMFKTNPKDFKDLYENMNKDMKSVKFSKEDMQNMMMGMMKSKTKSMMNPKDLMTCMKAVSDFMVFMKKPEMAEQITTGFSAMMKNYDDIKEVEVPQMKDMNDMMGYINKSGFSGSMEAMKKIYENSQSDYSTFQKMTAVSEAASSVSTT